MNKGLIVIRQVKRIAAVVCMSVMVFSAMALLPAIVSADCPDGKIYCYKDGNKIGSVDIGYCWRWWPFGCYPCDSQDELDKECNSKFPDCEGKCSAQYGLHLHKPCPVAPC